MRILGVVGLGLWCLMPLSTICVAYDATYSISVCIMPGHVYVCHRGGYRGGGAHPVRAPPKIGKNMIFWRKIVIFHTKYPQNVRASLRSAQFF